MAPSRSQLLAASILLIPTIACIYWYKKKRSGARSDPGDQESAAKTDVSIDTNRSLSIPLDIEQNSSRRISVEPYPSAPCAIADTPSKLSSVEGSPSRNFSRSYSAPIPIVLPKELRSTRNLNISDEELDLHIEKLKSSVVNTDPFELINQGKITNCQSPSKPRSSFSSPSQQLSVSTSPVKGKDLLKELLTPTTVATCEEESTVDNQEVVQGISNSVSFDKPGNAETIVDLIEQESSNGDIFEKPETIIVQIVEEIVEQALSKLESIEAIDTIVDKEVEEIIAKKDTHQGTVSPVAILEINQSLNIEESIIQTDSNTDKMTSTSNNIISGNAEKVQEVTTNSTQVSPSVCTEKVDEINLNNAEAKTVEDCMTGNDLDETLTEEKLNAVGNIPSFDEDMPSSAEERPSSAEERPSSAEERPSSAEERPSSAEERPSSAEERPSSAEEGPSSAEEGPSSGEERPSSAEDRPTSAEERPSSAEERQNSAEPVPGPSTGAIPKQKKKRKFRKLNCDLNYVGAKLMNENQKKFTNKAPKKNEQTNKQSRNDSGCEREDTHPHNSRRQSANPSPDAMLFVSSSLSSLNESENSHDSGKGCSDEITTPPPQPELSTKAEAESGPEPESEAEAAAAGNVKSFYEFLLNKDLVGKLIGKRGCFVNLIYTKTNAHVIVKDHPQDKKNKICIVDGTEVAIKKALKMIRHRFPKEKLEQFLPHDITRTEHCLMLPAGINVETYISCMVRPNHLFLQQQFHPTYPHFMHIHNTMNKDYDSDEAPLLPMPITANNMCIAYTFQSWNRAIILSVDEENETAFVKPLDFGGYAHVPFSKLKQLRSDLMGVPFQATECFLANIAPVGGEWCQEAHTLVSNLTRGVMLYTHVVAFTEDNIPLVNCQVFCNNQAIWINLELVKQGYATWIEEIPSTSTQVEEIPSTSTQVDTRTPVEC
ncbi:A-kinase anchor protein 1, mitochondrial-like isoform X2 [Harmonia axyridis]|uniref:A-kinase anchor protein 1, mitochondrial-like isoform X2 n=1 Tax=Harmonia axyridis TaxID=115357 RepID=UPI001E275960|nr:A-kinase anchor protein 1, mitochondrial-like isoform X2 [Harmonia axyridis]